MTENCVKKNTRKWISRRIGEWAYGKLLNEEKSEDYMCIYVFDTKFVFTALLLFRTLLCCFVLVSTEWFKFVTNEKIAVTTTE